jgi:hypothetical protein
LFRWLSPVATQKKFNKKIMQMYQSHYGKINLAMLNFLFIIALSKEFEKEF